MTLPYVTSIEAYDTDLGGPGVHRGLPGPELVLVLPLDEPLRVGWATTPDRVVSGWSSLSGLAPLPAEIHHSGRSRGVFVQLTVAGARAVFGVPAAELSGELLLLDDVAPRLRHLPERLAEAPFDRAAAIVAHELAASLARHGSSPRAEVGHALERLTAGARVQAVADEVGLSRRHLADLVRAECGVTPKELARIARFAASSRLVGRAPLAEVALRCGFADQAHLSREWQALAGCSPSTWLREEFPFLQDSPTAAVAGSPP